MERFHKAKIRILLILVFLVLSISVWITLIDAYPASDEQIDQTYNEESEDRDQKIRSKSMDHPEQNEEDEAEPTSISSDELEDTSVPDLSKESQNLNPVEELKVETAPVNIEENKNQLFNNNSKGYRVSLPLNAVYFSDPGGFDTKVVIDNCVVQISREWSPYLEPEKQMTQSLGDLIPDYKWEDGIDQYIGYYESRFLFNKKWQNNNNVAVSDIEYSQFGEHRGIMYHAIISGVPEGKYNAYTYAFIKTEDRTFLRIVAKYLSEEADPSTQTWQKDMVRGIACSLKTFPASGNNEYKKPVYRQERSAPWSDKTADLYDRISKVGLENAHEEDRSKNLLWGIFTKDMINTGINERIPELEEKLEYCFDVLLIYCHYTNPFPEAFMNKAREEGKIVELTYQLTTNDNRDLYARSISMDLYRQDPKVLEEIRSFAREVKAFGDPVLFRPCNEMNSDWVSYGGVVNMADPDIFTDNWRTIYRIFEEEGVDNCIWVYNPNNCNAPPDKWNSVRGYYPGNEYVDIIGVTGYNIGIYYVQWLDRWREFKDIYDDIQKEYWEGFGSFPWMITEFSSSSFGGDKAAWIQGMFDNIGNYPNIKIAVWFDFADYDSEGRISRSYWIDDSEETMNAFREGLKNS